MGEGRCSMRGSRNLGVAESVVNNWTVLAAAGKCPRGNALFLCRCICGTEKKIRGENLRSKKAKGCGCVSPGYRHGLTKTRTYSSWTHMKVRCLNPNGKGYYLYGGRGIEVCGRWSKFENFYADMGNCPEGKSLDRIDVNGNYEPYNCRWATPSEQTYNRRPYTHSQMFPCGYKHPNSKLTESGVRSARN